MHITMRRLHYLMHCSKYKELAEMYICIGLRTFALALVGIFVPIFFYKELGYTINTVMTYLLVWSLFGIVLAPFIAKLTANIGSKRSMLISAPLTMIYLLLLNVMQQYNIHYTVIAFLSALSLELFWMGFHLDFAQNSHKKQRGEEVSIWFSIFLGIGVLGPIVGAGIITQWSFKALFILSSVLMAAAMIPLTLTDTKRKPNNFRLKKIADKKYKKIFLIYMAYGVKEIADSAIWPLFIFLALKSVLAVGTIVSAAAISTAIFSPFVGKWADDSKEKTRKLIRLGSVLDGLSWPFRSLLATFAPMISVTIGSFLSFVMVDVPMYKEFYDNTSSHTEYAVMREIALMTGRSAVILAILAFGFVAGFWVMGLSNVAYFFL